MKMCICTLRCNIFFSFVHALKKEKLISSFTLESLNNTGLYHSMKFVSGIPTPNREIIKLTPSLSGNGIR